MRKVIISVAPVAAGTPVDKILLAEDVKKCVEAGASMCHLHCRKPDGSLTPDIAYMSECFDEILKRTDVVVQASTGGVSDMNIQERCNPLDYPRTETASLNGGTTNLGENVYINSFLLSDGIHGLQGIHPVVTEICQGMVLIALNSIYRRDFKCADACLCIIIHALNEILLINGRPHEPPTTTSL